MTTVNWLISKVRESMGTKAIASRLANSRRVCRSGNRSRAVTYGFVGKSRRESSMQSERKSGEEPQQVLCASRSRLSSFYGCGYLFSEIYPEMH